MAKRNQNQIEEEITRGVYLADGTYLKADAGYANGDLWIWMRDNTVTITDVFPLISNKAKTKTITYVITPTSQETWEGFTRVVTLSTDYDGYVSIRMRKEETENV